MSERVHRQLDRRRQLQPHTYLVHPALFGEDPNAVLVGMSDEARRLALQLRGAATRPPE